MILFQNGIVVGTATNTTNFNATGQVGIGARSYDGAYSMSGKMSNFRMVKGTAVYTSAFTPPTQPLESVSGTSLLTCQSPTTITDASPSNFTVTALGNTATSTDSPFPFALNSVAFDGTGDSLLLPSNPAYAFGSGDFTVELWLYVTGTSASQVFFAGGAVNTLILYISAGTLVVRNFGTSNLIVATAPSANVWNHIAVTRTGTTVTLFYNGMPQATATSSVTWVQSLIEIGGQGGGDYLNGFIQDLRITKGIARYVQPFTPPTQALPTY
jgi:hypothetical protein